MNKYVITNAKCIEKITTRLVYLQSLIQINGKSSQIFQTLFSFFLFFNQLPYFTWSVPEACGEALSVTAGQAKPEGSIPAGDTLNELHAGK